MNTKKKRLRQFSTSNGIFHVLILLSIGFLTGITVFSLLQKNETSVYLPEETVLCQNGSISLNGSCWLPVPQATSYTEQVKTCSQNKLKPASKEQLLSMASSLYLMGILPHDQNIWTSNTKPCGKQECRVVLHWQEQENRFVETVRADSYGAFPAICVADALTQKSKRVQVLVPQFQKHNIY